MDQPGQIINEDTITPPGVSSAVQLPPSKPKGLIIIFFVILVLILAGSLVYAGIQIGKKQSQVAVLPTPVPTKVLVPAENPTIIPLTPTPGPTANWKIYTNIKYGYEFKYPHDWFLEKMSELGEGG